MDYSGGTMPPSVVVIGECTEARPRFAEDVDEFLTDRDLFLEDGDLAASFVFSSDISTASCSSPLLSPSRVPSTSSAALLCSSSPPSTGHGAESEGGEEKQPQCLKPRSHTRGRRRAAACSKGRCVTLVHDKIPAVRQTVVTGDEAAVESPPSEGAHTRLYGDMETCRSGYLPQADQEEGTGPLVLSQSGCICAPGEGVSAAVHEEDSPHFKKRVRGLDAVRNWLKTCEESIQALLQLLSMRKKDDTSWQRQLPDGKAREDMFARKRREVAFKQQTSSEACWKELTREPRLALLLLAAATAFSTHNLIAPNMSRIAGTFHFSNLERDQKIGGNLTTLYYIPGCLGALCVGVIGDAICSSRLLYAVLMLTSASTFLTSFVQTYEQLAVLRVFSGLGIGGVLPLSYSVLGAWYAPEKRASSSAFLMSACGLGGFVGQSLAALLGSGDWRWPFAVTSFPLFLVSQLFFFYGVSGGSPGSGGFSVLKPTQEGRSFFALFGVARREKQDGSTGGKGVMRRSSDSAEGVFSLQRVKRLLFLEKQSHESPILSPIPPEDEESLEGLQQTRVGCSAVGADTGAVSEGEEHCADVVAEGHDASGEQEPSGEGRKPFAHRMAIASEQEEAGTRHRPCSGRPLTEAKGEQAELASAENLERTQESGDRGMAASAGNIGHGVLTLETARAMIQTKTNLFILVQALVGSLPWGMLLVYLHDFLRVDAAMGDVSALIAMGAVAVSSFCGTVAGGLIGERLYVWNKESVLFFCACVSAVRWIPFFLVFAYPQLVDGVSKTGTFLALVRLPFLLASLCLGGFLAALPTSNISAVLLNVNCPRARSAIFALYGVLGDIARSVGMLLVSYLVGLFGGRSYAFQATMLLWLPCALAFYAAAFVLRADEDRVRRLEQLEKGADGLRELDYPANIDEETPFLLYFSSSNSCSEAPHYEGNCPEVAFMPSFCPGACTRM